MATIVKIQTAAMELEQLLESFVSSKENQSNAELRKRVGLLIRQCGHAEAFRFAMLLAYSHLWIRVLADQSIAAEETISYSDLLSRLFRTELVDVTPEPHWLTSVANSAIPNSSPLIEAMDRFIQWLSDQEMLGREDSLIKMRPMINGHEVRSILPWLPTQGEIIGKIMDSQIEWQLQHPQATKQDVEAHVRSVYPRPPV